MMPASIAEIRPPPARWQVEWELCNIAADTSGVARDQISPASRMIQDLNLDSLALVEFILDVEDHFAITIPNTKDASGVAKQVFTRNPVLLRDFAELVLAQWGTGHRRRRNRVRARRPAAINLVPFLQLDGATDERAWISGNLYEPLAPLADGLPQYRRRTDGMRCVLLPAADVSIGSAEEDSEPDERPQHRVRLSAFLIDAEPVSTTAHARFLNSIGTLPEDVLRDWFLPSDTDRRAVHLPLKRGLRRWRPVKGTERMPMMLVSWYGANAYSLWANRRDWRGYRGDGMVVSGLRPDMVRVPLPPPESLFSLLPSEAQWEYAARGPEPRRFPWGDQPPTPDIACIERHAVGNEYSADAIPSADVNEPLGLSLFGLHHLAGNVWQWCRDWYSPDFYATTAATLADPQNATPTGVRSERGGSWVGPSRLARSSYRRGRAPEARGRCLGFRCVGTVGDLPVIAADGDDSFR